MLQEGPVAGRFEKLDPVAEGIVNENPVIAWEGIVRPGGVACFLEPGAKRGEVTDKEGGMGFAGRAKRLFDAEMDPNRAAFEPGAAPRSKVGRLCNFVQTEEASVEIAGRRFAARRHRKLDMMKPVEHRRPPLHTIAYNT